MPRDVATAFRSGELVLFAGAGISTENRSVLPFTLLDEICSEVGLQPDETDFPSAMKAFEDRHGRRRLLEEIYTRLDYIRSFPELERHATQFHRRLARMFQISEIFTTNWDTYFETACLAQPFVTPEDWGLWRISDRRVFKLHGSISSPASIVATTDDYRRCNRRLNSGLLGAHLKMALATKTIVFVGYSFGDSDFNAVYKLLRKQTGDVLPRAVLVTLSDADPPPFASDLRVIRTDGTYFLEQLQEELPEDEYTDEQALLATETMAALIAEAHRGFDHACDLREHPLGLFALAYQDGLLHAFEHAAANRGRGQYWHRCYVEEQANFYAEASRRRRQEKAYEEVAYVEGYLAGLTWLLAPEDVRPKMPLYFVFGLEFEEMPRSPDEFLSLSKSKAKSLHKAAYRRAERIVGSHPDGLTFHHPPVLNPTLGDLADRTPFYGSRVGRYDFSYDTRDRPPEETPET